MIATNVNGARNVARAAKGCGARFIHLSSDAIFDGEHAPYNEESKPQPIHAYAESKARGEEEVLNTFHVIARSRATATKQ
ncbi:MAG: sugar nucleotide-binding protein [Chloroflexi bacterium]|nr:sugar nucleotide-binding protein [Chloroflexota bacterium]